MEDTNNWFGIDANNINPVNFKDGEFIIWFHPRYKSRPIKWFTAKRVEKLILKEHAAVTKMETDGDTKD